MGGYISKFSGLIWAKKETRILILGLVRLSPYSTSSNEHD